MTSSNGKNLSASAPVASDGWQNTRALTSVATQMLGDENDYLAAEKLDIGRQTGTDQHELFVSCAAAEALQQQFDHLHPEYIAVHDIATASSRKLLTGIAAAGGRALQKLVIRRQGYGTVLATLSFIELPTAEGGKLRMYTTESDADASSRAALANTLLASSRLGVVMVGDIAVHSVAAALKPLHDAMIAGPWLNRHLLLLPLASASNLVTQGMELTRGTGVSVRTTPQVSRPADAWGFISGTWGRLREHGISEGRSFPALGAVLGGRPRPAAKPPAPTPPSRGMADTEPMPLSMRPMPPTAPVKLDAPKSLLDHYVHQLSELAGMVSCCVFDVASGREITHAGASPGAASLATHGTALLTAMTAGSRGLGLGHAMPDAAITLGAHHLLLRAVPKHPGLALHAVLDKTHANLTLARLQVLRMDTLFDSPGAG